MATKKPPKRSPVKKPTKPLNIEALASDPNPVIAQLAEMLLEERLQSKCREWVLLTSNVTDNFRKAELDFENVVQNMQSLQFAIDCLADMDMQDGGTIPYLIELAEGAEGSLAKLQSSVEVAHIATNEVLASLKLE